MGFSTVLIISLAAGVILIVGGGLMMYMANLVKSAYDIKVQINTDVEDRLTKMGEDLDKKSRWIKRDLLEEIEKIKVAIQTDNARKFEEMVDPLVTRVQAFEGFLINERAEWVKAVEADRGAIAALESRLKAAPPRRKADEPAKATLPLPMPAEGAGEPSQPPAEPTAPAASEPVPQRPSGPTPVGDFLKELR